MTPAEILQRVNDAFQDDLASPPPLTLRGGNDLDGYDLAHPFDPVADAPTDEYLERFAFWGLLYLDARSWRHYLPRLIDYAHRRPDDPAMVVEALVRSLRPPDRYPPRLASLTDAQEAAVRAFLEAIALGRNETSVADDARQALEEWWLSNPRARPTPGEIVARRAAPVAYRAVRQDIYALSMPDTLVASGLREIPSESRRVQTWGGDLCGDVPTMVAINITPVALRTFDAALAAANAFFQSEAPPVAIDVPGAERAVRLDGLTGFWSPGDPQTLVVVIAEADERLTLTIRTWERDDVRRVVEHLVESLEVR